MATHALLTNATPRLWAAACIKGPTRDWHATTQTRGSVRRRNVRTRSAPLTTSTASVVTPDPVTVLRGVAVVGSVIPPRPCANTTVGFVAVTFPVPAPQLANVYRPNNRAANAAARVRGSAYAAASPSSAASTCATRSKPPFASQSAYPPHADPLLRGPWRPQGMR